MKSESIADLFARADQDSSAVKANDLDRMPDQPSAPKANQIRSQDHRWRTDSERPSRAKRARRIKGERVAMLDRRKRNESEQTRGQS
jgi:hypothetical protein